MSEGFSMTLCPLLYDVNNYPPNFAEPLTSEVYVVNYASRCRGWITTSGSPSFTTSPSATTTSTTEPATSASTGISIFIDSRITTESAAATCWPTFTSTLSTAATSSATTVWVMAPS